MKFCHQQEFHDHHQVENIINHIKDFKYFIAVLFVLSFYFDFINFIVRVIKLLTTLDAKSINSSIKKYLLIFLCSNLSRTSRKSVWNCYALNVLKIEESYLNSPNLRNLNLFWKNYTDVVLWGLKIIVVVDNTFSEFFINI